MQVLAHGKGMFPLYALGLCSVVTDYAPGPCRRLAGVSYSSQGEQIHCSFSTPSEQPSPDRTCGYGVVESQATQQKEQPFMLRAYVPHMMANHLLDLIYSLK